MDAPCCQAFLSGFVSQEKIAAIHSACVCDVRSRALMEYAGRRLITAADCRSPMFASANPGLTCDVITLKNACAIGGERVVSRMDSQKNEFTLDGRPAHHCAGPALAPRLP